MAVNWEFIEDQEGGSLLDGYIPQDYEGGNESGVTIAAGLDLGQHSAKGLLRRGVPPYMVEKFKPYIGLRGEEAAYALAKFPLSIEEADAEDIDRSMHASSEERMATKYDRATGENGSFAALPSEWQTAIMSVSHQYGSNLAGATPNFWKQMVEKDYSAAIDNLRDFGDDYSSRRNREADMIVGIEQTFDDKLRQVGVALNQAFESSEDIPLPTKKPEALGGDVPTPLNRATTGLTISQPGIGETAGQLYKGVKDVLGFATGGLVPSVIPDEPLGAPVDDEIASSLADTSFGSVDVAQAPVEGAAPEEEVDPLEEELNAVDEMSAQEPDVEDPLEAELMAVEQASIDEDPIEVEMRALEQSVPPEDATWVQDREDASVEQEVASMSADDKASLVGMLGRQDTWNGLRQIIGWENPETIKQYEKLNEIFKHEPSYLARYVGNSMLDPIQMGMMLLPIPGSGTLSRAWQAGRVAKLGINAAKLAAKSRRLNLLKTTARTAVQGGAAASLGYVDETQESLFSDGKQSRWENAMLGAGVGAAAGPLLSGVTRGSKALTPEPAREAIRGIGKRLDDLSAVYDNKVGKKAWAFVRDNPVESFSGAMGGILAAGATDETNNPFAMAALGVAAGAGAGASTRAMRGVKKMGLETDSFNTTLQRLFVDGHGQNDNYRQYKKMRTTEGNTLKEPLQEMAIKLNKSLTPEQQKLAYNVFNGTFDASTLSKKDGEAINAMLVDSRLAMNDLSQAMVDSGMLTKEMRAINLERYIHASYAKADTADDIRKMGKTFENARVSADSLRMRGDRQTVTKKELEDMTLADEIGDEASEVRWEIVRESKDGNSFQLRKLWSKEKREEFGEIEHISYGLLETANTVGDTLSSYRFYDRVAQDVSLSSDVEVKGWVRIEPQAVKGAKVGGDAATFQRVKKSPYNKEEKAALTQAMRSAGSSNEEIAASLKKGKTTPVFALDVHGKLGGKWVHPEVELDLRKTDYINSIADNTFVKGYRQLNQFWKATKTIYNPTVHVNNMASNTLMYDAAGGTAGGFTRGLRAMRKKDWMYKEAKQNGAFGGGNMTETEELVSSVMADNNIMSNGIEPLSIIDKSTQYTKRLFRLLGKSHHKLADLYQGEDTIFRMGLYASRKEMGDTPAQAASFARKHLIDYEIDAPGVQALRQGPLPFFSFTYRVIPLLGETVIRKPVKSAKWLALMAYMNELGESDAKSKGSDVDKINRLQDGERLFGVGPKTKVWVPGFNGQADISRAFPGGDVTSTGNNDGLFEALPAPFQPSFGAAGDIIHSALGYDSFTGRELPGYKNAKMTTAGVAMLKGFIPNAVFADPLILVGGPSIWPKGAQPYISKKIQRAFNQDYLPTQEKHSIATAILSGFGIKLTRANMRKEQILAAKDAEQSMKDVVGEMHAIRKQHRDEQLTYEENVKLLGPLYRKIDEIQRKARKRLYGEE